LVSVSTRPEPGSKVALEIEVPAAEVDRHFATAYRHVAERTRVPGFRPGKAPRRVIDQFVGRASVIAEAMEHIVSASYDAALDQTDVIPIDQPNVDIDPAAIAEGTPITFTATVSVRPEVQLGAYTDYPFGLEIPEVTEEQVDQVIGELRDNQTTLRPVDERGAQNDDVAAVKFVGTIDGEPFEGGSSDRTPLIIGENRMIPGWEDNLVGMRIGEEKGFDITFPEDYRVEELQGKQAHFEVTLLDLRERVMPELDDEFARSVGEVETLDELKEEIRDALGKRAEAEGRHAFADRIIDFATSNATVEVPEVMIANEVEIMRDELRSRLAQQRIGLDQYLELSKQTPDELLAELREPAERRVRTLLVLSAIAEKEGIDVSDTEIDAEVANQLQGEDLPRLAEYLDSRRGRAYLRMTLRNRRLVDELIERATGSADEGDAAASESARSSSEQPSEEPAEATAASAEPSE
jgi:trigger factor